ncbi:MAG: DUF2339 domain-containing protein, partial [Armatimonadota bacterium]
KGMGYAVAVVAAATLLGASISSWDVLMYPILNLRMGAFATVIAVACVASWILRRDAETPSGERYIATTIQITALGMLCFGLSQETYFVLSWRWKGTPDELLFQTMYVTAIIWAFVALVAHGLGRRRSDLTLRQSALTVAVMAFALPLVASSLNPHFPAGSPFWNVRWFSYLGVAALLGNLLYSFGDKRYEDESEASVGMFIRLAVALLLLIGPSLELYSGAYLADQAAGELRAVMIQFIETMFWAVFALALIAVGCVRKLRDMKGMGYAVAVVAAATLLGAAISSWDVLMYPILNLRVGAFATVIAAACVASILLLRNEERQIAWTMQITALGMLWFGLSQETYQFFWYNRDLYPNWELAAQMGISIIWTSLGVASFLVALWRGMRAVRLIALGMLALTASKLFLLDFAYLDGIYRILSFGALGLALVGISWLYSHFQIGGETPDQMATNAHGIKS